MTIPHQEDFDIENELDKLREALSRRMRQGYYGEIAIVFQNGKIVNIKEHQSHKLEVWR